MDRDHIFYSFCLTSRLAFSWIVYSLNETSLNVHIKRALSLTCFAIGCSFIYQYFDTYNYLRSANLANITEGGGGVTIVTPTPYRNESEPNNKPYGRGVWWHNVRPIHALLWIVASYLIANNNYTIASRVLMFDTLTGIVAKVINEQVRNAYITALLINETGNNNNVQ